jgi:hypothetical protein
VLQGTLNDSLTVDSSYTTKGDIWHFKVHPSDGTEYGNWVSCPTNVTIENTEPTATNLQITPTYPITSESLLASYTWTDNDTGDSDIGTEIRWYKNGVLQPTLNDTLTIAAGNTSKSDIWHFKVRPSDDTDFGVWYSCPINVTIGNTPPQVTNVKINETSPVSLTEDLDVLYTYSDYDGDSQDNNSRQIRWYKTNATDTYLIGALNDSMTVGSGNTTTGDIWYFTIRVSDGTNLSSLVTSASVSIATAANQVPVASNLNFSISNPTTTDYLYINWTYSDGDSDPESGSMYYWYRNGVYQSQYDGLQNLSASATAKGEDWHVKIKPRDGKDFGSLVGVPVNVTIGNTAPSASDLTISPSSPITGSDLSVSYSFSDIDSDSESGSEIIWYLDGVLQDSLNDSNVVRAGNTSKNEEWHFKVRPNDGTEFGSWVSCPTNVTIGNTAPSASNLAITPSGAKTADDLTASYDFTDVDSGDSESGSLIRWYKNGLLQVDLNDSLTVDLSLTSKGENWYFTIEPSDGSDLGTIKTSAAILILNTAPSANSLTISPGTPQTTDTLTASYTWTDPDNATDSESGSLIIWYKDGVLHGVLNNSITVGFSYLSKGEEWHFKVKPKDGSEFGFWVSCLTNVTIINSAPIASGLIITPTEPKTTNDLLTSYTFSDVDSDSESGSEIIWYLNGVLQGSLNDSNIVQAGNTSKNEEWHFKVRPSDGTEFGIWVSCLTNVTIGNTVPSASNLAITPSDAKTADDLTASYDFTDVDSGDSESGSLIRWYKNGILQVDLNDSLTVDLSLTSKGENWYFTIEPSDGSDLGTIKTSAAILILNTAPSANSLTISPGTPKATDSLTASYTWSDPDNATDSDSGSLIIWYKDGVLQGTLNNSITVSSSFISKGEEWHFKVRPKDGSEFGSWVSCLTNVTILNSAPTASGLLIAPGEPKTINDLIATYTFSDVDSDTESGSEIIWYLDGVLQGSLNDSNTVQAGNTSKNEEWHFKVRPNDGTEFGIWVSCPTNATIGNTIPTASNLQLNPSDPKTGENLIASYDYYDADFDSQSGTQIRWFRNGVLQGNLNDSTTVDWSLTSKGENWYFTVTPNDGFESGDAKISSLITVGNTPPSVSNLVFIPSVPTAGNDLKIDFDWIDVDNGDTESGTQIRWYRNSLIQATYNDTDTIPGVLIIKGENWTVSIRTSDGTDSSLIWENTSVIVGNSAPSVTLAAVNPETPRTFDDLEATVDASDFDSDPILMYSIEWLLFGTPQPSYNNLTILPAEYTTKGQLWQIRVKAFDGENWSVTTDSIGRFILNSKPSVANVTVTGGTTTSTNISLTYDFFDIDGDLPSTPTITWRYIGETSGSVSGLLEIPSSYTVAGQRWWVEITPRDIEGLSGDLYNSWDHGMIIIIGNTPPEVQSSNITIKGEYNGTEYSGTSFGTIFNLNLHYNATDIDGEEGAISYGLNLADGFALGSEYRWYRNRSGVISIITVLNDQTTVPFYYTEKNDQWWIQIRPRDFYGDFGPVVNSSPIVIGNSYPFLREFNWVTSNPTKNDDIIFQFEYFDWDNDPINESETLILLTINQTAGGLIYRNCTISSVISAFDVDLNRFYYIVTVLYPIGEYVKNDQIYVILRPYDGTNWAIANFTSSIVTVANIWPTTTSRSLYPTDISNNDVLYLNWTYDDADGDPENLSWIILWYKNGVYQPMFDNQRYIPLNYTSNGEIWKAELQVYDGLNYSIIYSDLEITTKKLSINYVFDIEESQVTPDVRVNEFIVEDENLTISYFFTNVDDALGSRIQWFSRSINETWEERIEFEGYSSIDFSNTFPGEKWYCLITPFDGLFIWSQVNSTIISIESRPIIHSIPEDIVFPMNDTEGHYILKVNTSDLLNDISAVEFTFNDSATDVYYATYLGNNTWLVDLQLSIDDFNNLINSMLVGNIKALSTVDYDQIFEIYTISSFNFTIEDNAPPRVLDAFFNRNDDINPTNLTFYANVQEYGSGIAEVLLNYYFEPTNRSEQNIMGFGSYKTQEETPIWLSAEMVYHNTSLVNGDEFYVYKITIPFESNKTNWKVIYRVSTADNAGNVNPIAFDILTRDPDRADREALIYTPPGINPTLVLLIVGVTIIIAIFGSLVYVKFIRKPEIIGLDKELVINSMSNVSDTEISDAMDLHTIGVVISFFDQRHGPIPIIVEPEMLRDNFTKLVELSDRSFSGTGFSDDFNSEITSSYDFVLTQGVRTKVMSFGYALDVPEARGGQENITANILVHTELFPLVNQFLDEVQAEIHLIHLLMNDPSQGNEKVKEKVIALRKFVSRIVLTYEQIYGTTDLIEEDSKS